MDGGGVVQLSRPAFWVGVVCLRGNRDPANHGVGKALG